MGRNDGKDVSTTEIEGFIDGASHQLQQDWPLIPHAAVMSVATCIRNAFARGAGWRSADMEREIDQRVEAMTRELREGYEERARHHYQAERAAFDFVRHSIFVSKDLADVARNALKERDRDTGVKAIEGPKQAE